jgi:hypothetical protein
MKVAKRFSLLLPIMFAVVLVAWLAWSQSAISSGIIPGPNQNKPAKDPCWFMTLKGGSTPYEEIKRRQDREMYGYPTEIPLGEAVKIFNEEKQCSGLLAPYPPLTEDELIAAIVGGPDYGKQGGVWLAQKDALWKIASQRVLPKGSLLVAESGYRVQESPLRPLGTIAAKGIRITLLLNLDKDEDAHGRLLKPEQTLIVRKTYSKVEVLR